MVGYYNYTVILTYIGTLFGFAGIGCMINGNIKMALICLMIAGFCDMFDGLIAATRERTDAERRFGIQIDSLSDLICFGLLPSVIVFRCAGGKPIHYIIPAMYMLSALIRLAWFNVDEEIRQNEEAGSRESYLGLPVTSVALLIPLFWGAASLLRLPVEQLAIWLLLVIGIAFLAPFHLKKPKQTGKLIMSLMGVLTLVLVLIGV